MNSHKLLSGEFVDLAEVEPHERAFLEKLEEMAKAGLSYFDIERTAIGPGSPALQGASRVTGEIMEQPVYRVAVDITTRAGVEQGLILAPDQEEQRKRIPTNRSQMSVTQAADTIGISRVAVHKAIKEKRLIANQYGKVVLVDRKSVQEFKQRREADKRGKPRAREAVVSTSTSTSSSGNYRMAAKSR